MTDQLIAGCGCPIPPEVASGEVELFGWHLTQNHIQEMLYDMRSTCEGVLRDAQEMETRCSGALGKH